MRPVAVLASLVLLVALAACGGSGKAPDPAPATATATAASVQGPSEVTAEPIDHAGDNPFTPSVGKDRRNVEPPRKAVSTAGPTAYRGNLPGLYGGTMDHATCDARQLVTFLEANPAKAAAWARVFGIATTEIRTFVGSLTPVILRTDTRVTNHGFVNGVANPIQAVLQAGTAVFVNEYGRPTVKCYCGNPLTAPVTATQPTYTGALWSGFSPTRITIINQSTTVINVFRLYDPHTGVLFSRPAGTTGAEDREYHGRGGTPRPEPEPEPAAPPAETAPPAQTTVPSATAPPEQSAPPAATSPPVEPLAPAQADEQPSASFSPNPGQRGDTFVLSVAGFAPDSRLAFELTRPDGVVENYTIDVGSDGSGAYTFTGTEDVVTGTYHAVVTNPASGAGAQASVLVEP